MKKIYFLHGYQTSGKKFLSIKEYYKNSKEYLPIGWDWDENMDIQFFLKEKLQILKEDTGRKIIMADSMGANLAWHLVNNLPEIHYVMTNPVFCAEQIVEQEQIPDEMRIKIFSATSENIKNKNIHLIISKNDQILDNEYYKNIFGDELDILELEDEHRMLKMREYMPLIHQVIEKAFNSMKG